MRKWFMRYMKGYEKIFEPEIAFPLAYLLFLLLAFLSYRIPETRIFLISSFREPGAYAYLITLSAILLTIFFIKIGKKYENILKEKREKLAPVLLSLVLFFAFLSVYLTLKLSIAASLIIALSYASLLHLISKKIEIRKAITFSFILALLSVLASFYHSGIGFINPEMRGRIAVSIYRAIFHGFAVFSSAISFAFISRRRAFLLVSFLAIAGILSGFKSDAIAVIASAVIAGMLVKKLSIKEILAAIISVLAIITTASNYIAFKTYLVWKISPYLYPLFRSGFTFSVFSKILEISMPYGYLKGEAIRDTTQQIVSIAVLNYSKPHIITSTLLGPLTLDFGIFGIILTSAFTGIYLGIMSMKNTGFEKALYSMAIVHVLILIEVGLQIASILFLLSMLYLKFSEDGEGAYET